MAGYNVRIKKVASITLQWADKLVAIDNGENSLFKHYLHLLLFKFVFTQAKYS